MGIREGEPQPMMAMKVGTGREWRVEGGIEAVRVRVNSWQFCCELGEIHFRIVG
jgi:hypothetical protein